MKRSLLISLVLISCNMSFEKEIVSLVFYNEDQNQILKQTIELKKNCFKLNPDFLRKENIDMSYGYLLIKKDDLIIDSIRLVSPYEAVLPAVKWIPLNGKGHIYRNDTICLTNFPRSSEY